MKQSYPAADPAQAKADRTPVTTTGIVPTYFIFRTLSGLLTKTH
jgi:hypothetical protein